MRNMFISFPRVVIFFLVFSYCRGWREQTRNNDKMKKAMRQNENYRISFCRYFAKMWQNEKYIIFRFVALFFFSALTFSRVVASALAFFSFCSIVAVEGPWHEITIKRKRQCDKTKIHNLYIFLFVVISFCSPLNRHKNKWQKSTTTKEANLFILI